MEMCNHKFPLRSSHRSAAPVFQSIYRMLWLLRLKVIFCRPSIEASVTYLSLSLMLEDLASYLIGHLRDVGQEVFLPLRLKVLTVLRDVVAQPIAEITN